MAKTPDKEPKSQSSDPPAPEMLAPREQDAGEVEDVSEKPKSNSTLRNGLSRRRYRPSHRATFIGLGVVVVVLAINVALVGFVLRRQGGIGANFVDDQVTISQDVLDRLGVNRSTVGEEGVELNVGPDARFGKSVQVAGALSVGGALTLNSTFNASEGRFARLQAGETQLEELTVNGKVTADELVTRRDLVVAGTTRLQGVTTISKLLTAEGSANVAGNLSVGGALTVNQFHTNTLVVDRTITLGGHIITRGSAPSAGVGPAAGSNGTVSISGNDTAGTVAVNAGVGAGNGIVATVTFRSFYGNTPRVVITPIGDVGEFYIFRNSSGFSIGVGNALSPGGYAFDYIVMQ